MSAPAPPDPRYVAALVGAIASAVVLVVTATHDLVGRHWSAVLGLATGAGGSLLAAWLLRRPPPAGGRPPPAGDPPDSA